MSAHSGPLKAKPPDERHPGWTDGQWAFPKRLEELGEVEQWDQARVCRITGKSQATISRWLSYGSKKPDPIAVKKLEKAARKPAGWLLREPSEGTGDGPLGVSTKLLARFVRLGVNDELLSLDDEELGVVDLFSLELKKAILGIVHVYDVPLHRAAAIATAAMDAEPDMVGRPSGDAPFWFARMARRIPLKAESGEYPSTGSIKVPKK